MPPARGRELERLRAEPAADGGGQLRHRAGRGRIVAAIRRDQAVEREHHRRPGAAAAIVVLAIVRVEERAQQLDLIDHRPRLEQRRQRACGMRARPARRAARRPVQRFGERAQAIEAAEIALLGHRHVERGDRRAIDLRAVDLET